jgi:hypothetical protein
MHGDFGATVNILHGTRQDLHGGRDLPCRLAE